MDLSGEHLNGERLFVGFMIKSVAHSPDTVTNLLQLAPDGYATAPPARRRINESVAGIWWIGSSVDDSDITARIEAVMDVVRAHRHRIGALLLDSTTTIGDLFMIIPLRPTALQLGYSIAPSDIALLAEIGAGIDVSDYGPF